MKEKDEFKSQGMRVVVQGISDELEDTCVRNRKEQKILDFANSCLLLSGETKDMHGVSQAQNTLVLYGGGEEDSGYEGPCAIAVTSSGRASGQR